jgi:hypothetical protein
MCEAHCHEMAKENSPGLQPWVNLPQRIALKAPPTRYAGAIRRGNIRFLVQQRFWAAKAKTPTRRLGK